MAASLMQYEAQGADADQIADAVIAVWTGVDAALAPIIGQASIAVLYIRSRHIAGRGFPWLAPAVARISLDLTELRSLLAQQDANTAAAGGGALLQTFYELLASLVGPSLTERLLDAPWTQTFDSGPAAQDNAP